MADLTSENIADKIHKEKCEEWIKVARALKVCLKQALLDILQNKKFEGISKKSQQGSNRLQKFREEKESQLTQIQMNQWECVSHTCSEICHIPCLRVGQSDLRGLNVPTLAVLIQHLTNVTPPKTGWDQTPDESDDSIGACALKAVFLREKILNGPISFKTDEDLKGYWKIADTILKGLQYHDMDVFYYLQDAALDEVEEEQIEILVDKCFTCSFNHPHADLMRCEIEILKNLIKSYSLNEQDIEKRVEKSLHKDDLENQ